MSSDNDSWSGEEDLIEENEWIEDSNAQEDFDQDEDFDNEAEVEAPEAKRQKTEEECNQ